MVSAMPGYWTFTATARPSLVIARCTWPIDAAAIGSGSHCAKTCSGGRPSSSVIIPAASSGLIGGTLSCRRLSVLRTAGLSPSSMKLAIWPSFISTPFISPSVSVTSSAVCRARSCRSSWRVSPAAANSFGALAA